MVGMATEKTLNLMTGPMIKFTTSPIVWVDITGSIQGLFGMRMWCQICISTDRHESNIVY